MNNKCNKYNKYNTYNNNNSNHNNSNNDSNNSNNKKSLFDFYPPPLSKCLILIPPPPLPTKNQKYDLMWCSDPTLWVINICFGIKTHEIILDSNCLLNIAQNTQYPMYVVYQTSSQEIPAKKLCCCICYQGIWKRCISKYKWIICLWRHYRWSFVCSEM